MSDKPKQKTQPQAIEAPKPEAKKTDDEWKPKSERQWRGYVIGPSGRRRPSTDSE